MQRSRMYNLKLWCLFLTMSWGECLGCAGFTRCKPSFPTRAGGTQRVTARKNAWQEPRDLKEHIPWYSFIFVQPWESHWPGMPRVASRWGRCSGKSSAMEWTGCKHEVEPRAEHKICCGCCKCCKCCNLCILWPLQKRGGSRGNASTGRCPAKGQGWWLAFIVVFRV